MWILEHCYDILDTYDTISKTFVWPCLEDMTLAELQTECEQVKLLREEFQQEVGIFETLLDRVGTSFLHVMNLVLPCWKHVVATFWLSCISMVAFLLVSHFVVSHGLKVSQVALAISLIFSTLLQANSNT